MYKVDQMRSTKDTDAASISAVSFTVESLLGQIHKKLDTIAGPNRDPQSQNLSPDRQFVEVLVREIVDRQMKLQKRVHPKDLSDEHHTSEDLFFEGSPKQLEGKYSDEFSPSGTLPPGLRGRPGHAGAAVNSAVHEPAAPFNSIRDMPTARSQQVEVCDPDPLHQDLRHPTRRLLAALCTRRPTGSPAQHHTRLHLPTGHRG